MTNAVKTLYLCGAGNSEAVRLALTIHRRERRWERIVLLDDNPARHGEEILGVPIAGPFALLGEADREASEVSNLVARTTGKRWAALQKIQSHGLPFATLIHPEVDIEGAEVGRDLIVYRQATLSPEVSVDEASVVFMGAVVGHESRVGRCCVVASGAVLNARVVLEDRVYVGSNATVLPEIRIGAGATIGAGSTVVEDVPAGATAMGVPARILAPARDDAGGAAPPEATSGSGEEGLELAIARAWRDVLRIAAVDPQANFFDVGGTSLLAIQLQRRILETTGRDLPLTDLFRFPTIRSLARHVAASLEREPPPAPGEAVRRAELRRNALARRRHA